MSMRRRLFSRGYIRGEGLEVGALHSPFKLPRSVAVKYVDRMKVSELRHQYPELHSSKLIRVDIVTDAEKLEGIPSESQDFVIANHVLEHCEDPIRALRTWLRVLRPKGVVVLAVPDKRFTYDRSRDTTTLQHLLCDFSEGPHVSRSSHYQDWARSVEGFQGSRANVRALELEEFSYSIHFHLWDYEALRDLLVHSVQNFPSGAHLPKIGRNRSENLALLQRT